MSSSSMVDLPLRNCNRCMDAHTPAYARVGLRPSEMSHSVNAIKVSVATRDVHGRSILALHDAPQLQRDQAREYGLAQECPTAHTAVMYRNWRRTLR